MWVHFIRTLIFTGEPTLVRWDAHIFKLSGLIGEVSYCVGWAVFGPHFEQMGPQLTYIFGARLCGLMDQYAKFPLYLNRWAHNLHILCSIHSLGPRAQLSYFNITKMHGPASLIFNAQCIQWAYGNRYSTTKLSGPTIPIFQAQCIQRAHSLKSHTLTLVDWVGPSFPYLIHNVFNGPKVSDTIF